MRKIYFSQITPKKKCFRYYDKEECVQLHNNIITTFNERDF